jgi:formiminoglutamase
VALIGFPCDEGVRRNNGRVGAAAAPEQMRPVLGRLTAWDGIANVDLAELSIHDLGNIRIDDSLEAAQERLGNVLAAILGQSTALPIVIGGGHETAYGHYLGYVQAGISCGIINIDAHLDVRPYLAGGHSGSPFRQAMEHPTQPLLAGRYVVIGAQRAAVAKAHVAYVRERQGVIYWRDDIRTTDQLVGILGREIERLHSVAGPVMITVDADAFAQSDVPGVSAPNPNGFPGSAWPEMARVLGANHAVRSLDLVEINPAYDRDLQTARWAALGLRQVLVGLFGRNGPGSRI